MKHLGWPYLLFCVLGSFFNIFLTRIGVGIEATWLQSIIGIFISDGFYGKMVTPGFWFVQDLLYISIIYAVLVYYLSNKKFTFVLLLIALLVHVTSYYIDVPIFILRVLWGMFFYSLGYFFFNSGLKRIICDNSMIVMLICGSVLLLFPYINVPVYFAEGVLGNPILFVGTSISGSIFLYLISAKIEKNKYLEYIGTNTLLILFTSFYLLWCSRFIFSQITHTSINYNYPINILHFCIATLFCVIITRCQKKWFPNMLKYPFD